MLQKKPGAPAALNEVAQAGTEGAEMSEPRLLQLREPRLLPQLLQLRESRLLQLRDQGRHTWALGFPEGTWATRMHRVHHNHRMHRRPLGARIHRRHLGMYA